MSRIGQKPITLPTGITATIAGTAVTVKGKGGQLQQTFDSSLTIKLENNIITVGRKEDNKRGRELHGLTRALIQNMIIGVEKGYREEMDVVGVGWNAKMKGKQISLQVGYCHTVEVDVPDGVKVELPTPQKIIMSGISKQMVGELAAQLHAIRPPEPYKGKGLRYTGEHIIQKVGKSQVGK